MDGLESDLMSTETTPNLVYIVPDECEDAHTNCSGSLPSPLPNNPITDDQYALRQGDAFLAAWVPRILNSPAFKQDGLLVVTFDESVGDSTACCGEQPGPAAPNPGSYVDGQPGPGGGITGTVLVSPFISPGSEHPGGLHLNSTDYNHYSLLRSLEDLFGIDEHLGYAAPDAVIPFGSDVFDRTAASSPASCDAAPTSVYSVSHRSTRLRVRGTTVSSCGSAVKVVQVAVARRVKGGCRWLTQSGRARTASSCRRPFWQLAKGGGEGWSLAVPKLSHARYVVRVRGIDAAGRRETIR
jgi:hypothetical protein